MIVTHTVTEKGQRRIYIGSSGSVEFYIEPTDGEAWRFEVKAIHGGQALSEADIHACAVHALSRLCRRLEVSPTELQGVPFEMIAALHDADPSAGRRQPIGRKRAAENGYYAAAPHVRAIRPGPLDTSGKHRGR